MRRFLQVCIIIAVLYCLYGLYFVYRGSYYDGFLDGVLCMQAVKDGMGELEAYEKFDRYGRLGKIAEEIGK